MADDKQERLTRLAAISSASKMARIIEQSSVPDNIGRAVLESTSLQRELARASDGYRNLITLKDMLGEFGLRDKMLGTFKQFEDGGGIGYLGKIHLQHEAMMKGLTGSLSAAFLARQDALTLSFVGMDTQFEALTKSLYGSNLASMLPRYASISDEVTRISGLQHLASMRARELTESLAGITKPWSTIGNEIASIAAAMRLSQFEAFSRELPAFSKERSALKTIEFGQFQRVMPIAEALDDEEEGEEVYTEAGRNAALVAFPSVSYDEVLSATGWTIDIKAPEFIRPDGTSLSQAVIYPHHHYLISMVESHVKQRIAVALIAAGGMAALKRLFGKYLTAWERKRDEAISKGEPELHLIYYAEFMEIAEIVLNKELWASTFKAVFRNQDRFRMAITLLHGLRIQTAHSRPLTRSGKLRLLTEASELFEAMGVVSGRVRQ